MPFELWHIFITPMISHHQLPWLWTEQIEGVGGPTQMARTTVVIPMIHEIHGQLLGQLTVRNPKGPLASPNYGNRNASKISAVVRLHSARARLGVCSKTRQKSNYGVRLSMLSGNGARFRPVKLRRRATSRVITLITERSKVRKVKDSQYQREKRMRW